MRKQRSPADILKRILSSEFQNRFWAKVHIRSGGECWPWLAGKNKGGYGNSFCLKVALGAHCVAWMIKNKTLVPKGFYVLHSCVASRACCNPGHLKLGTHQDNMDDMANQGRRACLKGEFAPSHKLTNNEVLEIRRQHTAGGITHRQLAKLFGVASPTITNLLNRKHWAHL